MCKRLHSSFTILAFFFVVPSFLTVFPMFFHPPAKVRISSRTLDVDAASNALGSILFLPSGFGKLSASRNLRCNRTRCGGRTCRNKRRYIHRCWSRLGQLLLLILYPLRRGEANQAEILGAASGAEMPDIEQMKKIDPLMTCEIPFSQHVCESVFGVSVTDLNLGICSFVLRFFLGSLLCFGVLVRQPHSLSTEVGTSVLWVLTGTHPCDDPPRKDGELSERQLVLTCLLVRCCRD